MLFNKILSLGFLAFLVGGVKNNLPSNIITNDNSTEIVSVDKTLSNTLENKTNLLSNVYVNTTITSMEDFTRLTTLDESKVSNVIMYVDSNCNILDANKNSLNITLKDTFDTYLKGIHIPVIYVSDMESTDGVISYLNNVFCPLELAVCSDDYQVVKKIRESENGKKVRGIVDFSSRSDIDNYTIVKESTLANALTVILNEEQTTKDTIMYLTSRMKCSWVKCEEFSNFSTLNLINSGVYGLITNNIDEVCSVFSIYENSTNNNKNLNRMPLNIAHRGNSREHLENSLNSFKSAFELGATHIEIDIHLTADNELVVMHDETINRTTDGTGTVANMTRAELKEFNVIKNIDGIKLGKKDEIPFLDELFEEFKGNGKVIVIELKDDNVGVVPRLKELLDEYDMYDQVVAISFYEDQLIKMHELIPEVPCATLNNYYEAMFTSTFNDGVAKFNKNNFGLDLNQGLYTELFDRKMAERGFIGFYWTLNAKQDIYKAVEKGMVGITNNVTSTFSDVPYELYFEENVVYLNSEDILESTFEVKYKTYAGEIAEETLEGKVMYYETVEDKTYAILSATYETGSSTLKYRTTLFSPVVEVKDYQGTDEVIPEPEDNNLGLILGVSIPLGVFVLGGASALTLYFLKKKKRG